VLNHVHAGQEVFTREILAAGFKQIEEVKFLKENYFVRFKKVETAKDQGPSGQVEGGSRRDGRSCCPADR